MKFPEPLGRVSSMIRGEVFKMSDNRTRDDLVSQLEEDGESLFSGGFWNNIIDLSLTIVAVFASLVATILATTDAKDISRWIVASVAAIPAAATSLQRIVGIRERSNWYFLYAARVRSLATQLTYASAPNVEEFGKKYADLEEKMEEEWSSIGRSGAAPSGRTTTGAARRGPG
jgi:hypothetical protein